jgi:hypothetical protein
MIPLNSPIQRGALDNSDPVSQYNQLVKRLMDERSSIVTDCQERVKDLEHKRDQELLRNLQDLRKMGVKDADIPNILGGTGRKFRKLEASMIKEILRESMRREEWYPSTPLLEILKISYPDFRDFVKNNSDFIEKTGANKGRVYKLV